MSVPLCCSIQNLYTVLFVLQMLICVCAQISMRVRESRGVTGKPSPAVRSISKPRSRGIPHYITPSSAGNPRVPAIIPRGGNPCRPLIYHHHHIIITIIIILSLLSSSYHHHIIIIIIHVRSSICSLFKSECSSVTYLVSFYFYCNYYHHHYHHYQIIVILSIIICIFIIMLKSSFITIIITIIIIIIIII